MKFTYTNEDGPKEITQYGCVFKLGEAAEVSDEQAIEKLKGNPFFTQEERKAPASKKQSAKAAGTDEQN